MIKTNKSGHWPSTFVVCPPGVRVKAVNPGIVVALLRSLSEKNPWEKSEPPYPPSNGINSTTIVLLDPKLNYVI